MKLKKINLKKVGSKWGQGASHPGISEEKSYLAKIYGHFYAGRFSKQWYGFSFNNWGASGIGLNSTDFEKLWEIQE